jgi:sulfofructose kinase
VPWLKWRANTPPQLAVKDGNWSGLIPGITGRKQPPSSQLLQKDPNTRLEITSSIWSRSLGRYSAQKSFQNEASGLRSVTRKIFFKMDEIDVLCVGHAAYDLTLEVSHQPGPDEKTNASSLTECGGGPAANAAMTVARLGQRAAFSGYLGRDVWGERHLQEFCQAGVLTDLIVRGDFPTPLSVILVKPDGQRSVVSYRGGTPYLPSDGFDLAAISPKVILFDGHEPDLSFSLARQARSRRIPIVLDAGSLHRGTRGLLEWVDYLICSEKFARQFTGLADEQQAVRQLASLAPNVVVTLGGRGLVWARAEEHGRMPAFPVQVVDTTGAGDAFHGAFAACLALGKSWLESLRFASAVAAICCTKRGARVELPLREQVSTFMRAVT